MSGARICSGLHAAPNGAWEIFVGRPFYKPGAPNGAIVVALEFEMRRRSLPNEELRIPPKTCQSS